MACLRPARGEPRGAARAASPPSRRPGSARAGATAAAGAGPVYRFRDPDGHRFELYYEVERYDPPEHLRPVAEEPAAALHRPRRRGQAPRPRQRARRRRAREPRASPVEALDYRLYERVELDDGSEAGAWLSASIAAHELIYTRDAYGARGRLHHVAFWVDTREECLRAADLFLDNDIHIEAAPSKHAIAQGFFLYGIEPGGNRIEVTTGGYFVFDPEEPTVVWSRGRAREGPGLGRQDRRELPHLRHAARRGNER